MKKLDWIEGTTGLEADWANGDYTITIWEDIDTGSYEAIFCKSDTDIAHERHNVSRALLETFMRMYERDLRRWRKVQYGE